MLSQLNPLLGINVRLANDGDATVMAELFYSTRPTFYRLGLPNTTVDMLLLQQYRLQQMSYKSHYPSARDYILRLQTQVIGKLTLVTNPQYLHLVDFVIAPDIRGKGFGSAVLVALKHDAKTLQVPIRLSVALDNPRAEALYLKLGFIVQAVSEDHQNMRWE
jgi:ribosomal protein S18 acetylase RimI-like enzyme